MKDFINIQNEKNYKTCFEGILSYIKKYFKGGFNNIIEIKVQK